MKVWRALLLLLSICLLSGCLVTFKDPIPANEPAPAHLLGQWSRVDEYGEEQFLEVTRSGSNLYRAVSYVDSKDNTDSVEDFGFTVAHHGKRWYLSAGLPKSMGGNFALAGFEITDKDELVIYNLDVDHILQDMKDGTLKGEKVDTEQGAGALVSSPLPEVITDVLAAQSEMRRHIPGAGFCLMIATMLHSIATGNILPASVPLVCVDINPATVTKLMDRGSTQTVGIVSDAEPFLRALVAELEKAA